MPAYENQTVLDVVTRLQQTAEPTLTDSFSCRVGLCGSGAMMVNGTPRWTCRTRIQTALDGNHLSVAPLRTLPVIRDLAADMDRFFDKWAAAEARHHPTATRTDSMRPNPTLSTR